MILIFKVALKKVNDNVKIDLSNFALVCIEYSNCIVFRLLAGKL